jgi:uncharacterized DUF497 family protein
MMAISSHRQDLLSKPSVQKTEQHYMKTYNWNIEKNEILKKQRGISFEEIIFHIDNNDEIDLYPHPNQERYPTQWISVVIVDKYAYLVPYIESGNEIFLKTIIPSRKATKKYIGG